MTLADIKIDKLIRSKRKRIKLMVLANGTFVVRAPRHYSKTSIQQYINDHPDWVIKSKQFVKKHYLQSQPKKYITGEKFLYLGKLYELSVSRNNSTPLMFNGDKFILSSDYVGQAHELFVHWYRQEAVRIFSERADYYSTTLGLKYGRIKITKAKHRWGSCNSKKNICFSLYLLMAPLPVIDYVVIHELFHTIVRNHSKRFWSKLEAIVPDYKARRSWLRKHLNLVAL